MAVTIEPELSGTGTAIAYTTDTTDSVDVHVVQESQGAKSSTVTSKPNPTANTEGASAASVTSQPDPTADTDAVGGSSITQSNSTANAFVRRVGSSVAVAPAASGTAVVHHATSFANHCIP